MKESARNTTSQHPNVASRKKLTASRKKLTTSRKKLTTGLSTYNSPGPQPPRNIKAKPFSR